MSFQILTLFTSYPGVDKFKSRLKPSHMDHENTRYYYIFRVSPFVTDNTYCEIVLLILNLIC